MKKLKNLVVIVIAITMLSVVSSTFFASKTYAATPFEPTDEIPVYSTSPYQFNANEILKYVAATQTVAGQEASDLVLKYRMDITGKTVIPINQYNMDNTLLVSDSNYWQDGKIIAKEASAILCLQRGYGREDDIPTAEEQLNTWNRVTNDIINSLIAGTEGLTADDIVLTVDVVTPAVASIENTAESYSINSQTKFTAAVNEKINSANLINEAFYKKINNVTEIQHQSDVPSLQIVTVTLVTTNGDEYKMIVATDNNFYLLKTEAEPEELEFETELSYKAFVGDVNVGYTLSTDKLTCIPNYDKDNVKKDADVTAIIKSTTGLDILTVDGVAVGTDVNNPNADGWYYIDNTDKKVIAKLYPFEKYNNLNDNGTVVYDKDDVENNHRGKVKVVLGSIEDNDGNTLTSEEKISIQWPFRIIEVTQDPETVTEKTEKVTVTLTTNLPMDEDYLKEKYPDWKFTDTDLGKSQHQIYKVYEKKDGDVAEKIIVKENGRSDVDDTTVTIKWPSSTDGKSLDKGPATGVFTSMIVVTILVAGAYGITRYYKLKK